MTPTSPASLPLRLMQPQGGLLGSRLPSELGWVQVGLPQHLPCPEQHTPSQQGATRPPPEMEPGGHQ